MANQVSWCLYLLAIIAFPVFSVEIPEDVLRQAVDEALIEVESMNGSSLNAARLIATSTKLKDKLNLRVLPRVSLDNTKLKNTCPEPITCPQESIKYRPIDGSCHNRQHPHWGKSNTPFQRVLPNAYADGIYQPRRAADGADLKSGRVISNTFIKKPPTSFATDFTFVLMSWGQFITHDVTKAASFTSADGRAPQCCNATNGQPLDPEHLHPFCLPIDIPQDDPFYSQHGQRCMNFVRTEIGADYSCTLGGQAEQLNGNTHWLDGSMIYGSSQSELDKLRLGRDGLLKNSMTSDDVELLPINPGCSEATCFYAGDVRAQENPHLAILHTLMMREHNRVAKDLQKLNPLWNDQVLFQETRRIVIAQIQHVTYNEYLPVMLGDQAMKDYNLISGMFTDYDDLSAGNPSIWNEFAAAVFRVGHSQVEGQFGLYDAQDQFLADESYMVSNYFFDSSLLTEPGFIDNSIRGLTKQVPLSINPEYSGQLTNMLFKGSNAYGMDLVALNIQRGRDHGIADYNTARVYCGLPRATTFDDLINEIQNSTTIENLKKAYDSVDDIDLYIGCLAEAAHPVNGSLLGPTGLCIVSRQFADTKNNDRYFYDVGNQANSFTLLQMEEIRKASLARIMCDNNNGDVSAIQPKAFRSPDSDGNARQPCDSIPSMNLAVWEDVEASPSKADTIFPTFLLTIFLFLMP